MQIQAAWMVLKLFHKWVFALFGFSWAELKDSIKSWYIGHRVVNDLKHMKLWKLKKKENFWIEGLISKSWISIEIKKLKVAKHGVDLKLHIAECIWDLANEGTYKSPTLKFF